MSFVTPAIARATGLSVLALVGLLLQAGSSSASSTCLTGTDPVVAADAAQIAAVRELVESTCVCSSFDGSEDKQRSDYKDCVEGVIASQVPSALRRKCRLTVEKMYKRTTCGRDARFNFQPCVSMDAEGVRGCTIVPTTKRDGTTALEKCREKGTIAAATCSGFTSCIDAADTSGDLVIGSGDAPACDIGIAIRAAALDEYLTVDADTEELATSPSDALLDQRFDIQNIDGRTYIRALAADAYLRDDGGVVKADAQDLASATAWVIFVQTAVVGEATSSDAYIMKDGAAGPDVDILRADSATGEVRVVRMNIVDALSSSDTKMTLITR
ncbi:MAG TPA: hypothetical protein VEC57_08035 [Candidatus Limnocylindrales bacterium]|nr:hypothetical protein [Candidatus Limnocylindrales bacterium]